jgi:hydroxymethylpyrimidine pyrophosphatase-like HAD family hydrolase
MIRMIASDLDGTLLQNGRQAPTEEAFALIRAFAARGIPFCAASGRQYSSLKKMFAPVAEQCLFLCENGAVIYAHDRVLDATPMPRKIAEEIAWDFWQGSEGQGEVLISGEDLCYGMERGLGMADGMERVGNRYRRIHDPAEVPEDLLKVSVFLPRGVARYVSRFVPKWAAYHAAVAGACWIDTTLASKGSGIRHLCTVTGVDPADVMAFGDNFNDETMLDVVGAPYIMDGADPVLRKKYPLHTPNPERELHRLLREVDKERPSAK